MPESSPMTDGGYDAWMREVDREVIARTGLSIHDLEDQPFRDWYRDEMSPREAAETAIEYAGGGDLL